MDESIMIKLLSSLGYLGLIITLMGPILYFIETISLDWNHKTMLAGMVLWYAVSIFKDHIKNKA